MTEQEWLESEEGEVMEWIEMCEDQQIWLPVLNHLTRLYQLKDKGLHERLRGLVHNMSYRRAITVVEGTILLRTITEM